MFKKLIVYFFQGALFLIPIALTFLLMIKMFQMVGEFIEYLGIRIHPLLDPIVGIVVVVGTFILIGAVGSTIFFKPLFSYVEVLFEKAPLIKTIYTSIKDLTSAFVGQKKKFNKPVMVKISENPVIEKLGYITNEDLTDLNIPNGKIAVYLPFSYAFTGSLIIIDKNNVTPVNASSSEMMKFIISGGVSDVSQNEKKQ